MSLQQKIDTLLQQSIGPEVVHCAAVTLFDRDGVTLESAAGTHALDSATPMTVDSVAWIASLTKALTATAAMILVERGQLNLDAPAADLIPWLGEVEVLEGLDEKDKPILRPAKGHITLRQLLTHTAGFGYGFWSDQLDRFEKATGHPSIGGRTLASLKAPLLFDPGTDWLYGISIDWAGLMVEAASGQKLGRFMQDEILGPLGMTSTGFELDASMRERHVRQAQRGENGRLSHPEPVGTVGEPELEMGGGGLFSTVRDYARFCRMILNGGELDGVRVLHPETVATMSRNQMGDNRVKLLPTTTPMATGDAEFFPGIEKTWGLSFMINEQDAPTGRPAGSLAWAGMANSYYWIDPKNGMGGVFTSALLPFVDRVALPLYLEIEKTVYDHLRTRRPNRMIADPIRRQLDEIEIVRGRPMIITDADEVLFAFMAGLEGYLNGEGLTFDFSSFAITGNVKDANGVALDQQAVRQHLGVFFERHTGELDPVEHAAESLAHLSEQAQVVVLSNIPIAQREARQDALRRHGMDYPLIANEGAKGPAVHDLFSRAEAPAIFIDDIPHNHSSVAEHADDVHRLHFVADPRLARLIPKSDHAHDRVDTWPEARPIIERRLFGS